MLQTFAAVGVAEVALLAVAGESLAWGIGCGVRTAVYLGGIAGLLLAAVGLPFAIALSGLAKTSGSEKRFWHCWGTGLLVRLALLVTFACGLAWQQPEHFGVALLSMMALYLPMMLAEAVWTARILEAKPLAEHP